MAGLRRERGLSERSAAKLLRTSQTQLRRMEDPRYLPSLRSLARLAHAYGYTLTVRFTRPEPEPAPAARASTPRPSGSASPSKARPAAPGRGRAGARARSPGAARRPRT
ncbi:MAG: helix-turn-helix domain-containing protein [Candidatus Limnocylindria bacterium]